MKTVLAVAVAALVAAFLVGCATTYPVGGIYTEVSLPVDVTSNTGSYSKVGKAECKSILAMVAIGDASIEAAKKNGGITEVHHVDWHVENILGIIGKYTVTVYGD